MFIDYQETFYYTKIKLIELLRKGKIKIIVGILILSIVMLSYGIFLLVIFKLGISNFLNPPSQSISSTPIISIPKYMTFRDLLANGILIVYLLFLAQNFLKSVTGLSNPFVSNLYDVNFQILIPVDPYTAYFSNKLADFLKNSIFISLMVIFLFSPLIFGLNISYSRIILIILNYLLGWVLISIIGDIVYFISNSIRAGKNWAMIYTEKNNLMVIASSFIIPAIYIQLLNSNLAPTYQLLSTYFFVPFINISVSNTGLLFRSGIPLVVYLGTITCFIEIIISLIIVLIFIKISSTTGEIGDLMPVLEYLEFKKPQLSKDTEDYFINPAYDFVKKNEKFNSNSSFISLIQKEWLLLKRSNDLKINIFMTILGFIGAFLFIIFPVSNQSIFFQMFIIVIFNLIFFEFDTMVKLFHSVQLNSLLLNVNRLNNNKIKIVFSILLLLPFEIIFIYTLKLLVLLTPFLIICISEILNRINFRNFMIVALLSFMISPALIYSLIL